MQFTRWPNCWLCALDVGWRSHSFLFQEHANSTWLDVDQKIAKSHSTLKAIKLHIVRDYRTNTLPLSPSPKQIEKKWKTQPTTYRSVTCNTTSVHLPCICVHQTFMYLEHNVQRNVLCKVLESVLAQVDNGPCTCSVDGDSGNQTTGVRGCADHVLDGGAFCYTIDPQRCKMATQSVKFPGAAYRTCTVSLMFITFPFFCCQSLFH